MERREKSAENQKEQQQQDDGKVDVKGLRFPEKLRLTQARPVDEREKERINRHAVALRDVAVTGLMHALRIGQVRPLVTEARRRGHQAPPRVRFEAVIVRISSTMSTTPRSRRNCLTPDLLMRTRNRQDLRRLPSTPDQADGNGGQQE